MGEDLIGYALGLFVSLALLYVVIYFAVLAAIREARRKQDN